MNTFSQDGGLIAQNFFQCVKSVRIRSYSGPHFLAFRLNNFECGHFLRSAIHVKFVAIMLQYLLCNATSSLLYTTACLTLLYFTKAVCITCPKHELNQYYQKNKLATIVYFQAQVVSLAHGFCQRCVYFLCIANKN